MKAELSVFLITKNEEANLEMCLSGVKDIADEIIIVDSGSTDKTLEIADKSGAKIYQKPFVSFTEQKNFALSKVSKPWALNLDADEYLTPPLAWEIKKTLAGNPQADGYELPRSTVFLGRQMRYCGIALEYRLRLVRTHKARYTGGYVHEVLEVSGPVERLKNIFMHNTYVSIEQYFAKFNHYTTLAARTMLENNKKFRALNLLRQPLEFFRIYFLRLGFLDGIQGFLWAAFYSFYPVVKYAKLWDMQRRK
ncbi:MAG: glycosyltransferase family 2 protein [Elusimicrobiota bacterium]|jgi:glycosyltransferase involved in cell wall biosynthesis|nr:glycosyltransferase family 2 protein [Elusimicrobiota bacterium]